MSHTTETIMLHVSGMSCPACEQRIERKLANLPGVSACDARYGDGTVQVTFAPATIELAAIHRALDALHYPVVAEKKPIGKVRTWGGAALILSAIVGGYWFLERTGVFYMFPMADQTTTLPVLFVIGLLTSLHCVAMCGGITIAQCAGRGPATGTAGRAGLLPGLLYNGGRVASYTVIGGIVGAMGAVVTPSGSFKGIVAMLASAFMVIMGLNMLGFFSILRRLMPRMPKVLVRKVGKEKLGKGPFIVGLLNGLMPCGPLQAMQLYALSTGSAAMGALSMLLFSLGTVPLMFGLGALSAYLSGRFTRVMLKVSAVLVILLGLMVLNNGLSLAGAHPLF